LSLLFTEAHEPIEAVLPLFYESDACTEKMWRKVDMPCKGLDIASILKGIESFSKREITVCASLLGKLANLENAYVSIPTRPPVEGWVKLACPGLLKPTFDAFSEVLCISRVVIMSQYEGKSNKSHPLMAGAKRGK
jgi:wyosine [tRNA(Phe)-imidazoG37] synthetase (radical SAM superfamily)